MMRRPPRSTLFPYTTPSDLRLRQVGRGAAAVRRAARGARRPQRVDRSEEHTSELQSLRHLVCRLLLEKKKRRASSCFLPLVRLLSAYSLQMRLRILALGLIH